MPFDVKQNVFRGINCGVMAFVTKPKLGGTGFFKVSIGVTPDQARHAWFDRNDLQDLIMELVRVHNEEIPGEDKIVVCRTKDQMTMSLL